jgi:hypothetical protein
MVLIAGAVEFDGATSDGYYVNTSDGLNSKDIHRVDNFKECCGFDLFPDRLL